ncbi:glycosyltransferase [Candidatus Gracilibacteria bacterium]|nr:glycosyltransferase [Candidatus Gracilibacteria bacterium]
MKTAIIHDYFLSKSGGDRLVVFLAENLPADIVTWFTTDKTFDLSHLQVQRLGRPILMYGVRHFWQNILFRFGTKFLNQYDVVIFSGNSISAVGNVKGKKVLYCHTPPRYAYDQLENYLKRFPAFMRPFVRIGIKIIQHSYEKNLRKMDVVVANSATVAKRLKDYFDMTVPVVYPACDIVTTKFTPRAPQDYFISWARLEPMKRIDVVIEAFKQRPDKKILIASHGSLKDKLVEQAKGYPNIQFVGLISDAELSDHLSHALASIYIPVNEDFGMTPIESMAAGTPTIGVREGGLLETIDHLKNGYLCPANPTVTDIIAAIDTFTPELSASMEQACRENAKRFSKETFLREMKKLIEG